MTQLTGYYSYQYTPPCARTDFILQIPFAAVFDSMAAIQQKTGNIAGFPMESVDRMRYQIWLSTGMTMYSWGEYVNLNFYEPQPGLTRIVIESRPRSPQQTNAAVHQYNVNAVYSYIIAMFSRPPVMG